MKLVLFVVILVVTPFKPCDSARILGVVSFPSYSHQVVFQPVWRELSLRGHQVTTIVTDNINDTSLTNLTEIVIKEAYTSLKKHNLLDADANHGFIKMIDTMINMAEDLLNVQYSHPQVQRLIHNRSELFDLVIFEALSPTVVYAWRFDCPAIGLSSLDAGDLLHSVMGNPTNPIANPDPRLKIQDDDNLTFKERLYSVVTSWFSLVVGVFKITPMVDKIQQKYFGESVPPFFKLIDKVEMIMIATNPIFHATRPLNPNTITIGSGIHILPPKPLPNDVKAFLDGAKEGVVYFSLGSNVKGNLMLEDTKKAIYKAFSELPYKFLIKVDWVNLTVPENVKVGRWLPQQDILRHPNIKLFITQGGLQSLQEAVTNAVPLVSIPFFGDQQMNTQKIVKRGFAVKLERTNITTESMKWAIQEVITNPKYKLKAIEMQDLMYDEPMTCLERAVWWIEYVIRHKGAPHFKSNAAKLPLYQYFLLDVIGVVLVSLIVVNYILYKIIQLTLRVAFRLVKGKQLKKKKE